MLAPSGSSPVHSSERVRPPAGTRSVMTGPRVVKRTTRVSGLSRPRTWISSVRVSNGRQPSVSRYIDPSRLMPSTMKSASSTIAFVNDQAMSRLSPMTTPGHRGSTCPRRRGSTPPRDDVQIPGGRGTQGQVRIVREQRMSIRSPGSREGPGIRCAKSEAGKKVEVGRGPLGRTRWLGRDREGWAPPARPPRRGAGGSLR